MCATSCPTKKQTNRVASTMPSKPQGRWYGCMVMESTAARGEGPHAVAQLRECGMQWASGPLGWHVLPLFSCHRLLPSPVPL